MIGPEMVLVGLSLMSTRPASKLLVYRRWQLAAAAIAVAAPERRTSIDLIARADSELAADALSRGVRGIAAVYMRAGL